ncbi:GNAT superfamily N-acetyltransferase [Actinokineospora baliensis]|nr:GNAT superfamily N-acetyltransferase [Actinokineospora baliensis]
MAALRRASTEEDKGAPVTDPDFDAEFARWWQQERSRREFWIAEADRPIGFCNLVEFTRMPRPGIGRFAWGYISNFYVLPEHRNEGVGAQLIKAALDYADSVGYVRVVLSPTERAIPFYQRAGFGPADSLMLRLPPTE